MKKNQLETLEMMIKKKKSVDGLDSRLRLAVEEISSQKI